MAPARLCSSNGRYASSQDLAQRFCTKFRSLAAQSSQALPSLNASHHLIHFSSPGIYFSSSK
ncbi:hypothetical protein SLEP1_g41404 [Rubroshorea leprosula]|uniref:Uncharacterized protein n=1 Tax=Rubroshorea leprosula TaxID=152421 RepID=A0AAV5L6Z4_9ROSI|nr:hypothetical protein SLEP1_g41404 [Rubroshorea leprosula]